MNTKYTAFRCPVELVAKMKFKADTQRRSMSNYLVTLIERDTKDMPAVAIAKSKKK